MMIRVSRFVLYPLVFIIFAFCSLAQPVSAGKIEKDMRGVTFTDPSKIFPMDKEWIKKPVKYEEDTDLFVVLDQDIYYTLLPAVQKFGKERKIKVTVKEGTCGISAGMLAKKSADIGGFCCPPGYEDRLPGLKFHTLGIGAIAFFVHPENPLENVSSSQLRDIYRGKIYKWSELKISRNLSGPARTIKAIGRIHCKKRPGHWRQLLDKDEDFSPRMFEVGSMPDMIAQTAGNRDAIGWETLSMVEKNRGIVKMLKVDSYAPNDSNALAALKYPFYRTYNITTWEGKGLENKYAQELTDYLILEFEKLKADKFGFVSQKRLRKAGWKFKGNELVEEPR